MSETATQFLPTDDPGRGLTSAEAAERLRALGPAQPHSSRSTSSIIAGNVFTLFNLIIGIFFVLILSLGLWADAIFGLIAIINSWIGIRQELKAKETLDRLAVLVAPRAEVIRDGAGAGTARRRDRAGRPDPAFAPVISWSPTAG